MSREPNVTLSLGPAPQLVTPVTTRTIMRNVLIALAPCLVASLVLFGLDALRVTATSVVACVLLEWLWCRLRKVPSTVGDLSAAVTGVLLAFNIPAGMPTYMVVVGAFVAIILTKELFGGIGCNFANPAIMGRIVLSIAFPAAMTTWVVPRVTLSSVDAVSSATMLAPSATRIPLWDMFVGTEMGTLGETSALAILVGLAYLLATHTITWHIPVVYVGLVFVLSALMGLDAPAQVLSGGLMLGAVFMAPDYPTATITPQGKVAHAIGLALITCLIRFWGNMNEGCAYAILFMNLLAPYINELTVDTPLGGTRPSLRVRLRDRGGETHE